MTYCMDVFNFARPSTALSRSKPKAYAENKEPEPNARMVQQKSAPPRTSQVASHSSESPTLGARLCAWIKGSRLNSVRLKFAYENACQNSLIALNSALSGANRHFSKAHLLNLVKYRARQVAYLKMQDFATAKELDAAYQASVTAICNQKKIELRKLSGEMRLGGSKENVKSYMEQGFVQAATLCEMLERRISVPVQIKVRTAAVSLASGNPLNPPPAPAPAPSPLPSLTSLHARSAVSHLEKQAEPAALRQASKTMVKNDGASPLVDDYVNAWDASLDTIETAFRGNDQSLAFIGEQLAKFWENADRQSSILNSQEPGLANELNSIYQQSVATVVECNLTVIDNCLERLIASRHDRNIPLTEWLQLQKTRDMAERLIDYAKSTPATVETTISR